MRWIPGETKRLVVALSLAAGLGCGGELQPGNDAGLDADSDADVDADSDADVDADSDADVDADSDADGDADNDADADSDYGPRLRIHADNPHFLEYDGEPFLPMSFAVDLSGHIHARRARGINLNYNVYGSSRRSCGVVWTAQENLPYLNGRMDDGLYEPYWAALRGEMDEAETSGDVVTVGMWATTRLEYGRSGEEPSGCSDNPDDPDYWAPDRFEASLWSELRGGPIPVAGDPKDNFYSLFDYESFVYGVEDYDPTWEWTKRNQYRQEELLAHVYDTFMRVRLARPN